MSKSIKINCFYIPKIRQGGLEKIFFNYLLNLSYQNDHKVYVWCDKASESYIPKEISISSIKFNFLSNFRYLRLFNVVFLSYKNSKNYIHCVQYDSLRPLILLARFIPLNIFYHERSYLNSKQVNNLKLKLKKTKKQIRCITVNSQDQLRLFQRYLSDFHIIRLFNPIITNQLIKLKNTYKKRYSNTKVKNIYWSGRTDTQKNFEFIIKNINSIKKIFPSANLVMYLNDLPKKINIDGIIFKKFSSNFLEDTVNNCDLFIITTKYEGFSNLLFELNYLEFPVLCSIHRHGFEEMRNIFNFECFDLDKIQDFEEKLLKFNQKILHKKFINNDSLKNFHFSRSINQFNSLIRNYTI